MANPFDRAGPRPLINRDKPPGTDGRVLGGSAMSGAGGPVSGGGSFFKNLLTALPMLLGGPGAFGGALTSLMAADNPANPRGLLAQIYSGARAQGKSPAEIGRMIYDDPRTIELMGMPEGMEALLELKKLMDSPDQPDDIQKALFAAGGDQAQAQELVRQGLLPEPPQDEIRVVGNQVVRIPPGGAAELMHTAPFAPNEPPSDAQMLEYVARLQGLDLTDPAQLMKAVDLVAEMKRSTVTQFNIPTGYAPTGESTEGIPHVAPMPGTPEAREREAVAVERDTAFETIDEVIKSMETAPGEYGIMAPLKQGARRVTSAVEQLGTAATGVPMAEGVGKAAGALREGALAEAPGVMTRDEAQAALDRVATVVARQGASGRVAQQEIQNVREGLNAGEIDITTAVRRLRQVQETIGGLYSGTAEVGRGGGEGAAPQVGPQDPQIGTVEDGYKLMRHPASDPNNWEKVQ